MKVCKIFEPGHVFAIYLSDCFLNGAEVLVFELNVDESVSPNFVWKKIQKINCTLLDMWATNKNRTDKVFQ